MKLFPCGHATHPQWGMAAALVLAQLRAQMALPDYAAEPTLGLLYITDHYTPVAQELLDHLAAELPGVTDWVGTVGLGIAASQVEYIDEPALAVMLCDVPADRYRVFSGVSPLPPGFRVATALVHADGQTPDLQDLLVEMGARTETGYLFGGLASSRLQALQFALAGDGNRRGQGAVRGLLSGGLSGVAFAPAVGLISRVTHGCQPVAREHTITAAEGNVLLRLDDEPALDVMLRELGLDLGEPRAALPVLRETLVGLSRGDEGAGRRTGHFSSEVRVRHLIGLDPMRRGLAIAEQVTVGDRMAFSRRNAQAAKADLMRICAEVREELEPARLSAELASALAQPDALATPHPARGIAGALYVSCIARGGPHFGAPHAELQIVRRALGEVPLVGFFAGGEIAHDQLHGYTGVLTVFTAGDVPAT